MEKGPWRIAAMKRSNQEPCSYDYVSNDPSLAPHHLSRLCECDGLVLGP